MDDFGLVLNAGSSSLKFCAFRRAAGTPWRLDVRGQLEGIGSSPRLSARDEAGQKLADGKVAASVRDGREALDVVAGWFRSRYGGARVVGVGHRVVHGGTEFPGAVRVDDRVKTVIARLAELAPLHNPPALEAIKAAEAALPDVPQVAVFDTAFFAGLPPRAYIFPLPYEWYEKWGVRRFGFHGISNAYCAGRAAELLGRSQAELRLVICHLGGGCSATAVRGGAPIMTTMGFTPLAGLMMGTRSGSIDPGMLVELLRVGRLDADAMDDALEHLSGLLGVSGLTGDFRDASEAAVAGHPRATLAIVMFIRRAAAAIGAAATALPRLDAVVFTGGIGENAAAARAEIVGRLAALRVAPLPAGAQPSSDALLSAPGQTPAVLRITAREDLVIAAQTVRLVSGPRAPSGTGPQPGS